MDMRSSPHTLSLKNGELIVSLPHQANGIDLDQVHIGRNKRKKSNYFYPDVMAVIRRLGLTNKHEIENFFDRVLAVYESFWLDAPGSDHLYMPSLGDKLSERYQTITDYYPTPNIKTAQCLVGFFVPAYTIYQRLLCEPNVIDTNAEIVNRFARGAAFYAFDQVTNLESITRNCSSMETHDGELKWMFHAQLIEDFQNYVQPIQSLCAKNVVLEKKRDKNVLVDDWIKLSFSAQCAYETRIHGLLQTYSRTPTLQSSLYRARENTLCSILFDPLLSVDHHQAVRRPGRILIDVSSEHLKPLCKAGYRAGLLPLTPVPEIRMDWRRKKNAHDLMFETLLKGNTPDLLKMDALAIQSKGITC